MISNRMSIGMALLIVLLGTPMKSGQAFQCDNLQRLIKETYNFKPAKLSDAQREAKATAMDHVWDFVKSDFPPKHSRV